MKKLWKKSLTPKEVLVHEFSGSHLHNINVSGETASGDIYKEAAASYLEDLAKIIKKKKIFIVDETASCWKKMPSRTFIAKEEKSMLDYRPSRDSMTVLLAANTTVDLC